MRAITTLLVILSITVIVILLALYNGYCLRHGGFPDREVSYGRAIADVIARYPPVIEVERRDLGGGRSVVKLNVPERAVHYGGIEEFRRINPDCCAIVDRGSEGYEPSPVSRLLGYESRIVRVRYAVRYLDESSELIERPVEEYVILSRCGEVFNP